MGDMADWQLENQMIDDLDPMTTNPEPMSPDEFKERMQKASEITYTFTTGLTQFDAESAHSEGDDLMCQVLRELGYGEGIDIFEQMEKWYA